jgi:hypothetical protein
MARHSHLPKYNDLLNPLFKALHVQATVNSRRDPFSFTIKALIAFKSSYKERLPYRICVNGPSKSEFAVTKATLNL